MMNYNIQKGQFRLTTAHPRGSWWEFYRVPCPICNAACITGESSMYPCGK